MQRNTIITAIAVVVALSGSVQVYAQEGPESEQRGTTNKVVRTVETNVTRTEAGTKEVAEGAATTGEDKVLSQQDRIEARKAELKERMEQKAAERKEKLEGRRLAICQNRQGKINALIDKSAGIGKAKLARIQAFEAGIAKFYTDQNLTSDVYDAALAAADEKEALAIAALNAVAEQQFDCTAIDGAKPSDTIKSVHETKRLALKEYRTSVQELLKVVREAFTQKAEAQNETE